MPVRAKRLGRMERLPCTVTLKAGFCWKTMLRLSQNPVAATFWVPGKRVV